MQSDMFEPKERVYLKSLQDRKKQLKAELDYANQEINDLVRKAKSYVIGYGVSLARHPSGDATIYTLKPSPKGDQMVTDFFAVVSVDLLTKALQQLAQETHNGPESLHCNDGGGTSNGPW